jgi:signal transduction histidine kinase
MPVIDADAVQMRQLFQNLISNSIRYRKDCQQPVIRVHGTTSGGMCKIFVEDNGMGFEEQHLDRIFRPFQQLHGKGAGYGGIGMGLAICRKIVERLGGSITARSAPGQGSTFIIDLPVKQSDGKEA